MGSGRARRSFGLAAVSIALLAALAPGQEPKDLPEGLVVPGRKPIDEAELAGLPPGARAEVLTLKRAYTLAIVKGREPVGRLAEALDPKALDERAARLGASDFARFRDEFLREDEAPEVRFRDPSASWLGLLRQRMVAEEYSKNVYVYELLTLVANQLVMGEATGVDEFTLDRLQAVSEQARQDFAGARRDYRDRLDALKAELGLSPHAPIVADAGRLAPLLGVFDAIDRWQEDPKRKLDDLPRIVNRLAPLEGGGLDVLDGRPRLADLAGDPARLEPTLRAAEALAIRNRGGDDPAGSVALRVRRRVRRLVETHADYESSKRQLVALLRQKDDEFERLIAPPGVKPATPAGPIGGRDLIALNAAVYACEARLVSLWASFQAERLGLARDLRAMPANDWASFYAAFSVPIAPEAAPPAKGP